MQKKRIALVVDKENWAFANIAKNIKRRLSDTFEFKIIPMSYLDCNFIRLFLLVKDYDLIHFFWRGHLMDIKNDFFDWYTYEIGSSRNEFEKEFVDYKKITTAVYDHLFIEDHKEKTIDIFNRIKNYYVSSNRLLEIYNKMDLQNKPLCVITDGISLEEFYPKNIERFDNIKNREVVIGWCGNSNWSGEKEDYKGLKTILNPAIEELQKEGYKIKTNYADSQVKMIPHNEMVDYYKTIDILVCSSKIEGTPNPVLEAMACGVPIISTDVGIVPDVFGKNQKEYILQERNIEEMKNKLRQLINNPTYFKKLSDENLKSIEKFTWDNKMKDFKKFFTDALKEVE